MNAIYFRTKPQKGKKRVTIAGIIENNNTIKIGVAICSLKDQFTKIKGREVSAGRALVNPEQVIEIPEGKTAIRAFVEFSKQYVADFNL